MRWKQIFQTFKKEKKRANLVETKQFIKECKEIASQYEWLWHWETRIKVRDGYKCQVCRKGIAEVGKRFIQAHHILYRSKYPELKFNDNNGITLCHWCHKEVHLGGN